MCVVGGGSSDPLVVLECVVVCSVNDRGWMKVSCPIVCAVWAAAVAAFLVGAVCVFFELQGVCALSTSTPLGKCNRCAFQCSSSSLSSRAEGLKTGSQGALTSFWVLWPSMHLDHEISPWPPTSGSIAISEKKRHRMWQLITPLTWQSKQADHTHTTLKTYSAAGIKRQIHNTLHLSVPACCQMLQTKKQLFK